MACRSNGTAGPLSIPSFTASRKACSAVAQSSGAKMAVMHASTIPKRANLARKIALWRNPAGACRSRQAQEGVGFRSPGAAPPWRRRSTENKHRDQCQARQQIFPLLLHCPPSFTGSATICARFAEDKRITDFGVSLACPSLRNLWSQDIGAMTLLKTSAFPAVPLMRFAPAWKHLL